MKNSALVLIALVFVGLAFTESMKRDYFLEFDEFLTIRIISGFQKDRVASLANEIITSDKIEYKNLSDEMEGLKVSDGNSFLYYFIAGKWAQVVGYSDFRLRLLSIFFFLAGAFFFLKIKNLILPESDASSIIALALVLLNPYSINIALMVRCYSLAFALAMMAVYYSLLAIENGPGIKLFMVMCLSVINHYMSFPLVFSLLAIIFLSRFIYRNQNFAVSLRKTSVFIALVTIFSMAYLFVFTQDTFAKLMDVSTFFKEKEIVSAVPPQNMNSAPDNNSFNSGEVPASFAALTFSFLHRFYFPMDYGVIVKILGEKSVSYWLLNLLIVLLLLGYIYSLFVLFINRGKELFMLKIAALISVFAYLFNVMFSFVLGHTLFLQSLKYVVFYFGPLYLVLFFGAKNIRWGKYALFILLSAQVISVGYQVIFGKAKQYTYINSQKNQEKRITSSVETSDIFNYKKILFGQGDTLIFADEADLIVFNIINHSRMKKNHPVYQKIDRNLMPGVSLLRDKKGEVEFSIKTRADI